MNFDHDTASHYTDLKIPLAFETFGKTSDETWSLIRDLVGKAVEINQLSFSRLLSH